MNDAVAVGLITSASTLLAVALTGAVSIWIARSQLRHQARVSTAERDERRAAHHRDVRRDAYVRFLARVDEAYRQLDLRWAELPPARPEPPRTDPVYGALRGLDEAHNLVLLEGPDEVTAQAAQVVTSVDREYRDQGRVRARHPGGTGGAAELEPDRHAAAVAARVERREAFMAAARRAVGGDLPSVPGRTSPA